MFPDIKNLKLEDILGERLSHEEALDIIHKDADAFRLFQNFPSDYQNQVLGFIQGMRGLPILYDSFFQTIFNPSTTPERLERFLSCLMGQQIHIMNVIPREGSQLSDKGPFVIMDVLVQTEDGSYINVEMQKHGYEFTGPKTCLFNCAYGKQYEKFQKGGTNLYSSHLPYL